MVSPNHPHIQTALSTSLNNSDRLDDIETKTDHITVTQAVALDTMESDIAAHATKLAHMTVTQAVNLDSMESAVAAVPADTAARLTALEQFQPKAFGRFTTVASPVLLGTSYNVASVSRGATGQYSVVIDTDLTTANATVIVSYEDSTATIQTVSVNNIATTGFNIGLRNASNAFSDASESVSFVVFENNT